LSTIADTFLFRVGTPELVPKKVTCNFFSYKDMVPFIALTTGGSSFL